MAQQLGFYFDAKRCVQCHACEVACKETNDVELGPRWRRVMDRWEGQFPKVTNRFLSAACMHCAEPACIDVCPAGAITKRAEDGIVVVNVNECIGCRSCEAACPYGAPQFGRSGKMQKCDLCVSRLTKGQQPACVSTCPGEALAFGSMEELAKLAQTKGAQEVQGRTKPSLFLTSADPGVDADQYVSKFFPG